MTPDALIALFGIALTASWTPGPNNALLASSGATFGARATIPHVLGIVIGFPAMIFLVGSGLGQVFRDSGALREVMRIGGAAIILWLAWRISRSDRVTTGASRARPFTFLEAVGFQWINPKGWAMAVAVTAQFVMPEAAVLTAVIVAGAFAIAGLGATLAWMAFGTVMQRFLATPARVLWFNRAMAAMLAGFSVYLLVSG